MGDDATAMTPAPSEQSVFAEAILLPTPESRAAYLDSACGTDTALHQRVEALLRAAENAGDFLEKPPTDLDGDTASTVLLSELSEKPGDKIDRYKLLQQIGEGGCGVVYMAEQLEPVKRRVALKVIKLGMDTKSVIARFEAERQALALMDHPNIAKVFDAGATETGRPYFVMELVRGIKITDFCDENNLSTTERLKLFTQVCQAIQHAHQKGIIHRDIKPSNILVTQNEKEPVPKVIDFGIAKATTDQRLTDKTVFTAFEQFIGTPAYMSPEQAMMTSLDIDTRTDIYALGVLLYELLTGTTPFNANELMAAGLDAMRRTIRDQEPVRPSTRLSTMLETELTVVAQHRHSDPARLDSMLRGDLDWIVLKAIEKDRTRRYETASGLAADIQRHLSNEPVTARPPTRLYRLQKLVSRNKFAFSASAAIVVALTIGLLVASFALTRERVARDAAEAAQRTAAAEAAKHEQAALFLKDMMHGIVPAIRGDRATMRTMLAGVVQRLERLDDQPAVEADVRNTLALAYSELGDSTNAAAMLRDALALQKKLPDAERPAGAASLHAVAEAWLAQGKPSEAAALHREVLKIRRALFGNEHADVAQSLHSLAFALARQGREHYAEAEPFNREALAIRQKLLGNEHPDVARSLNDLGLVLWGVGQYVEAESAHREALSIRRQLFGESHPEVAMSLDRLGLALDGQRRFAEAEAVLRASLTMRRKLLAADDPNLIWSLHNLAGVLRNEGETNEADELTREAQALTARNMAKPGAVPKVK